MDFEKRWLDKLRKNITEIADQPTAERILSGCETLTQTSPRSEIITWSANAISLLETSVGADSSHQILLACACHIQPENLEEAKSVYQDTGDLRAAHEILQSQFESFLRDELQLEDHEFNEVVHQGWGLAGIIDGNQIIATKIPKSAYLQQYLAAEDPAIKREIYCHCPRVREAISFGIAMPPRYCSCGAGFYQDIWARITDKAVSITVEKSLFMGDDLCRFRLTIQ